MADGQQQPPKGFWDSFKDEWQKKVIAGIIAVILSALLYTGKSTLRFGSRLRARLTNISNEEAGKIAKNALGNTVVLTIPFRNVEDGSQYIAVLDDPGGYTKKVFLLTGRDGHYRSDNLHFTVREMSSGDNPHLSPSFGLVDIDDTGKKQIFGVMWDGGSGAYGFTVAVYDVATKATYKLDETGQYGLTSLGKRFSENIFGHSTIQSWLEQKGNDFIVAKDTTSSGYIHETNLWRESQPNFSGPIVDIHEFSGPIPRQDAPSVACRVEDGNFEWISFFKGAVFAYDRSRNVHYVVWIPQNDYEWAGELTAGQEYLWWGNSKEDFHLAFNKRDHLLSSHHIGVSKTEFDHLIHCAAEPEPEDTSTQ